MKSLRGEEKEGEIRLASVTSIQNQAHQQTNWN
jgi:hypothetical protein